MDRFDGLVTPTRVDLVDLAHHRVVLRLTGAAGDLGLIKVALVDLDHIVADQDRLTHAHRRELAFSGALERPIFDESLGPRAAHDDGSVVAQHQAELVATMPEQTFAFLIAHGVAFSLSIRALAHSV